MRLRAWPVVGLLLLGVLAVGARAERAQLQVCVVETAKNSATDPVFCDQMVTRLGEFVAERAGRPVRARLERVDSGIAAQRLKAGHCDAVLVVGPTRPPALRRLDAITVATGFGVERNFASVSLIIAGRDPRLQRWLAEGFPLAIARGAASEAGAQ